MTSARHYCPFDPTMAEYVIGALAAGRSLASVCTGQGIPSRATVMHWVAFEPGFEARYRRAREIGMEAMADDLMDWSRRGIDNDLRFVTRAVSLAEVTQARRTRIAVRQWLMARWAPDAFGSRTAAREDRAEASAAAPETAERARRDPDAPPRLSPRPFAIPPIGGDRPITIGGLPKPLDIEALHAAVVGPEAIGLSDNVVPLPTPQPTVPEARPPRHSRRDRAAMARTRPAAHCPPPP
jgi:hypothetical protein